MSESRVEQRTFGWVAEAGEAQPQADKRGSRAKRAKAGEGRRTVPKPRPTPASRGEGELPPDNELWDVHAAARFLKRSVSWVYHKAEEGTLPVKRIGGWGLRFIPAELRAWVEDCGARRRRG